MASSGRNSIAASDSPAASHSNSALSTETTTSTSVPVSAVEKTPDDTSKLKAFLGILRKFIGVSDMAAVRFSLPAQLLEPTPNLEYWNYLDRPETFISIGDSDDDLGRMLAVLRFWYTKDLKYIKGKPCKPYNSVLGEFFRATWTVPDDQQNVIGQGQKKSQTKDGDTRGKDVKVSFLTEQTSHHPPVSAFWIDCPEKGIHARGFDQISAKFTGTSVRVGPGNHNLGIFITIDKRDDEEYRLTHPMASLGGLLRGSLSITVADVCYITCPKTRLKTILHYLEEGWLGRTQNKMIGIIYRYDPDNDKITRLKDIPEKDIVARVEGNWREKIYYSVGAEQKPLDQQILLLDLEPLNPQPKIVPPEADQLPNESHRFWKDVTTAIIEKRFGEATKLKQAIEERQRERAAERQSTQTAWQPRFFTAATTPVGRPDLTEDGRATLQGLENGHYQLAENKVYGA